MRLVIEVVSTDVLLSRGQSAIRMASWARDWVGASTAYATKWEMRLRDSDQPTHAQFPPMISYGKGSQYNSNCEFFDAAV